MKILVTGATGNVGGQVVSQLATTPHELTVATRDGVCPDGMVGNALKVDFEQPPVASPQFDAIFIVRPPHLADPALFVRFLAPHARDTRIVFLSVQGADTAGYLPHAKIEKAITAMGFPHVYIRPSYFMENLTTTLWPELEKHRRIYLPAGALALDWVSVRDVAAVAVAALTGCVQTASITVCSGHQTDFRTLCEIINRATGAQVRYQPASLWRYCRYMRRSGAAWSFIMIMLLLHFLPRFSRPAAHDCRATAAVLGRKPDTLDAFVRRHHAQFAALAEETRQEK